MFRRKNMSTREPPQVFGYDRDAFVSLVKRHYKLIVDMGHLHPKALQAPDEAGWTDAELNVDALRTLRRDEAVDDAVVYYETKALSYLRNKWQPERDTDPDWHKRPFAMLGLAPFDKTVPPHVISLTYDEAEIGVIWLIDTERGCVYPQGDEYYLYDDAPPEAEGDKPWLNAKALSFQTFFDKMHKEISSLNLVPEPTAGNFGAAIRDAKDPDAKAMKQLYREHGWPGAFREDEFLRAAVPARAAILDDEYDWSDE